MRVSGMRASRLFAQWNVDWPMQMHCSEAVSRAHKLLIMLREN